MGLYSGGLIFQKNFGLAGDLCMPKNSALGVQSEILVEQLMYRTSQNSEVNY